MKTETFEALLKGKSKNPKAVKFISELRKNGIPLSAIDVNDWVSSSNTIVFVTIPYGRKNGGLSKAFKNRFGPMSIKSAVKFFG